MLREGFPMLAILLAVNSECHQVDGRVLISKLGRRDLLPIGKELDVTQEKLLCALLFFAKVGGCIPLPTGERRMQSVLVHPQPLVIGWRCCMWYCRCGWGHGQGLPVV